MGGELRDKVASGVAWSLGEKLGTILLQMVVSIVVARLLMPDDVGLMALMTFFSSLALVVVDSGFLQMLIRKGDPAQGDYKSVFLFNVVVSWIVYGVLVAVFPAVAAFYGRPILARIAPVLDALKADGIPVSLDSYQPATQAYALSRGVAYLNDIRGFPDAAFYPQLAKSSAKLVVMHSVQDGQADRREAPAGDIMDHIAAFFDARIAALTGAGIKRNRLVLDPGMGFFLGAAPETSLSVLARFDELRLRFDLPVLLSVSRKSFLRALTGRGPGDVGAATLAAELAAAAGGADFIRTHEPRPLRDGLAVLAALKETARIR